MWQSKKRNIILFYLLTAAMSCWFIGSNWIYFWTKYMTYGQLGWIDAIGFGFGMLLEIPSGAVADLLGKRKTILYGLLAGAVGVYLISFSSSMNLIFMGWMITQICFAFYSGAAEALVYDTLVDIKEEKTFDKVITKSSEIESYVTAASMFLGGVFYAWHFRLPHIMWATSFLVGVVLAWFLIEPNADTEKFSLKAYAKQLLTGFKELAVPELRRYIGFFFILVGVYFMYAWSFVRPAIATSFGFLAKEQSMILPILTLYGAFAVRTIPYFKKRISGLKGLLILSGFMATGFFLASFPIGVAGLIPMFLIATAGKLATPWISILINKKIDSRYRATTLSTVALLNKVPYVLIAVVVGKMIENNKLDIFNQATAFVVILVAGVSVLLVLSNKRSLAKARIK